MVNVDTMTDDELRTKLIEYGFPVMPITGTTRKVMMKKLKLLMENKSKPASDRRSLAQFSSEEESDNEVKVVKKDRTRRATMAVPPMQPPTTSKVNVKRTTRRMEDSESDDAKVTIREEKRSTRTTKILNMAEADDISDSEPDIVETDYKISPRNNSLKKDSPVKLQTSTSSFSYKESASAKIASPKYNDAVSSIRNTYASTSPSRYSSFNSPSGDGADKLNQIRSRLSLGSSTVDSYNSPVAENSQTPFLSNFTKRLSQLSTTRPEYEMKSDVIKEHDSNGAGSYSRTYLNRPKPKDYGRDYQSNQDSASKGNYISFLLVGAVFLFFLIITALYWGLHSGNNNNEIIGLVVPYCHKEVKPKRGENCILEDDVQGAVDIYKLIKPELIKHAIGHLCTDSKIQPYMTDDDIVKFIQTNYKVQDPFVIIHDLNNFVVLLFRNPFWEVSVLQSKTDIFTDQNVIGSSDVATENQKENYKRAFTVLNPSLPIGCSLYLKFSAIFKAALIIISISCLIYLSKYGFRYYKHYQQRSKDEVILMVEKILEMVQANANDEGDNYLVINHVRDMILPIDNRKQMEKTWQKAVNFINENESRVRTEVQVVKGESYEVWRWLGGLNVSTSKNKSWQGQAFETQIGSVNSPPCSPTPCLKVRGMVDDGDRNLHTIREAVLVKCAEQCRILHCAVDVNSKCVYLKCADQNDAAIAYRNLHGWWYASHLVTVKYLRLERYMQRFPDSPVTGPPFLKPTKSLV